MTSAWWTRRKRVGSCNPDPGWPGTHACSALSGASGSGLGGYGEVVSGGVVEGDFLAGYPFEFGDELAFAAQRGEAVMPVGAEVGEAGGGVGEQVPDDGEDGVADGDQGAFLAAAPDDPLVAGGQEGPGPGGGDGGLAEGATEPGVALAGGGGFAAPGRLAGPRRELGPGHQVAWGREAGHVGADLGDEVLGGDHADPRDVIELGHLGGVRGDRLLDPGGEGIDLGGERVDPGQHVRVTLPADQGGEHGPAGGAEDVADH